MLQEGRIPLNPAEHNAVDNILSKNPGKSISVTRSDPGESGLLLMHVDDDTYRVDGQGRVRKQKRKS